MANCNAIAIDCVIKDMFGNKAFVPRLMTTAIPTTIPNKTISKNDLLISSRINRIIGTIIKVISSTSFSIVLRVKKKYC